MTHHLDPVPQTTKVTPLADEDDQDEQGGDDHKIRCIAQWRASANDHNQECHSPFKSLQ